MKILSVFGTVAATAVLGMAMSTSASAAAVVFKNPVGWAGTGCKANSVSVTGANSASLTIAFDAYEAGKDAVPKQRRVACNFAVPIQVPRGFQVSRLTTDWEIYAEGKGEFSRKYFLTGQPTRNWKRKQLNGGKNGKNFVERDALYHGSFATACHASNRVYNLRISSQIKPNNKRKDYIAVDAADLRNTVKFLIRFRKC